MHLGAPALILLTILHNTRRTQDRDLPLPARVAVLTGTPAPLHSDAMTRRRDGKEPAQRDTEPAKMAPPTAPALQDKGTPRSSLTATRLERFARTPIATGATSLNVSGSPPDCSGPASVSQAEKGGQLQPPLQGDHEAAQADAPPAGLSDILHEAEAGGSEPTIRDIFAAISSCNANLVTLNLHMGDLKDEMLHVRQDLHKMNDRVKAAEDRISQVEDQLPSLSKATVEAAQHIKALLAKVDDLENRSRRSNVRIVGVPEKEEGRDPVAFFEAWLMEVMGKNILSPFFAIERAHRVPTRPPAPGAPPRPVLMKLLHFRDRDAILRAAREKGDIMMHGHRISFYPDFSADIQKKRMQFLDIKKRLRNLTIPYSMQYSAKLRVVALGSTHFFDSPRDALHWMDNNERSLRRAGQQEG